jgi:hypothetical protein
MIIELTKGYSTVVDDDVSAEILQKKYCAIICGGNKVYAVTNIKGKTKALHRIITNAPKGMVVDHINGDTLDNRKENLRLCLHKENVRNQKLHPDKLQKYKGVDLMKLRNKYRARIVKDYKNIHIGLFDTPEEAAFAYNEKAKELFGEFAYLNII